mmetsp:Transcript_23962/g.71630  ORF Transcript_23962/g.71630 Transcript_23962/m.71630 type:complete len:221 (-) Transcript_23962:725-1387(-)
MHHSNSGTTTRNAKPRMARGLHASRERMPLTRQKVRVWNSAKSPQTPSSNICASGIRRKWLATTQTESRNLALSSTASRSQSSPAEPPSAPPPPTPALPNVRSTRTTRIHARPRASVSCAASSVRPMPHRCAWNCAQHRSKVKSPPQHSRFPYGLCWVLQQSVALNLTLPTSADTSNQQSTVCGVVTGMPPEVVALGVPAAVAGMETAAPALAAPGQHRA